MTADELQAELAAIRDGQAETLQKLAALSLPPPGGGVEGARRKAVWHARKSLQYALSWAVGMATPFVFERVWDALWRVFQ